MEDLIKESTQLATKYGAQIVLALISLVVGLKAIKWTVTLLQKRLIQKKVDSTAQPFILGILRFLLKFALILLIAQTIGINTTSFVAILGAAGLAIGLALKDSLGNFAASFMILFFKPYQVGDFVEAKEIKGTVKEVQLFSTVLITPDNRRVIIPNGLLFSSPIVNYSAEPTRRSDLIVGIAYEDDIPKAKSVLLGIATDDNRILKDPPPFIAVNELADSSVNLLVRYWCNKEDYWDLYYDLREKVKLTLDEQNISIPYPQRVIHQAQEA